MQRVEALAMGSESLRDTIAGAVGLEQAIPASSRSRRTRPSSSILTLCSTGYVDACR